MEAAFFVLSQLGPLLPERAFELRFLRFKDLRIRLDLPIVTIIVL